MTGAHKPARASTLKTSSTPKNPRSTPPPPRPTPPSKQVAVELNGLFNAACQQHPGGPDEFIRTAADDFTEAFTAVAFDPALIGARQGSVSGGWGGWVVVGVGAAAVVGHGAGLVGMGDVGASQEGSGSLRSAEELQRLVQAPQPSTTQPPSACYSGPLCARAGRAGRAVQQGGVAAGCAQDAGAGRCACG